MAVLTYTHEYDHGSSTVSIVITYGTGTNDLGGGRTENTNTLEYSVDGGTVTTITGLNDEATAIRALAYEAQINAFIDSTPNPALEKTLIDNGYIKDIS